MKPEQKVATLEQCQRLVELGVVLETDQIYVFSGKVHCLTEYDSDWAYLTKREWVASPDVAELLQILHKYTNWEMVDLQFNMAEYLCEIVINEIEGGHITEEIKL